MRKLGVFTVLALVASCMATSAFAYDSFLSSKPLKWKEVGAIVYTDTTFLTDEADTIRTETVYTSDWDWNAASNGVATDMPIATVCFVVTGGANNGVSDSLYFTIEKGAAADTFFTHNGNLAAAMGSCALAPDASPNQAVYVGYLVSDPNGQGVNNVWLAPKFRLRVSGDVSGTTPKLSGLKCYIAYPKRALSQ